MVLAAVILASCPLRVRADGNPPPPSPPLSNGPVWTPLTGAGHRAAPASPLDSLAITTPPVRRGASPRGALFRSTILPGWGQLATGHPVKAVVMVAGVSGLGIRAAVESRDANAATRRANGAASETEYDHFVAQRDEHLNARDNAVTWLILLWSYNMVDAYVEGHFVGFDGLELRIFGAAPLVPAALPLVSIGFHW